jgi:hypothetical protein
MMGIHKIPTSCAKAKFKSNQMNKSAMDLGASSTCAELPMKKTAG